MPPFDQFAHIRFCLWLSSIKLSVSVFLEDSFRSTCSYLLLVITPFDQVVCDCLCGWPLSITMLISASVDHFILPKLSAPVLIDDPLPSLYSYLLLSICSYLLLLIIPFWLYLFYWWSLIQFVHICCCDVFISAPIDNFNMLKPGSIDNSHSIFSYLVYVDVFISAPTDDFNMLIPVLLLISFNQYGHVCLGDVFISDPLITSFFCAIFIDDPYVYICCCW